MNRHAQLFQIIQIDGLPCFLFALGEPAQQRREDGNDGR